MINYVRALLGLNKASHNRTIVGKQVYMDVKEAGYIKDSNTRLTHLFNLYKRYQVTLHAPEIKAVYEKTKYIHSYLVAKQSVHALELFHIQHTDHFLNTFGLIIDVHQSNDPNKHTPVENLTEAALVLKHPLHKKFNGRAESASIPTRAKPPGQTEYFEWAEERGTKIPRVGVPEIAINPNAKILYTKAGSSFKENTNEISLHATEEEKKIFLLHLTDVLGVQNISYIGNALMNMPDSGGSCLTAYVPIISWKGNCYAFRPVDYRLFPVKVRNYLSMPDN